MEQPTVTRVSSACCTTGILSRAAVLRASRITRSSRIGLPSSLTATAPARFKAAKFVSFSPTLPTVAAAIGNTFTSAPRSGDSIQRVISGESFTGTVLGMAQTEVNPPAAAAAVPVAIVSLCECPGSRRCTCRSIKPGATMQPRAFRVRFAWPRNLPGGAPLRRGHHAAARPSPGRRRWPDR